MDDPKERAERDQIAAEIADFLPPTWRRLYKTCQEVGFTDAESFALLQTYILSIGGNVNPPKV